MATNHGSELPPEAREVLESTIIGGTVVNVVSHHERRRHRPICDGLYVKAHEYLGSHYTMVVDILSAGNRVVRATLEWDAFMP